MSQGFYKNDDGQLLHGPNFVEHADWQLDATDLDDRTQTIDGWAWYDNEAEACSVLGIPEQIPGDDFPAEDFPAEGVPV